MPISGLVVTFSGSVQEHQATIRLLRRIPEVEIGPAGGSKLAIVVDTATRRRDQEIWHTVQQLPGVIDLAVALVAFEDDNASTDRWGGKHDG